MAQPHENWGIWLRKRIEFANGLDPATRAAEFARVRRNIEDVKVRNVENLGDSVFDSMLAELDKASGAKTPPPGVPDVGAFD